MKPEDARRKIELLRRMKTENGAMAAEADSAERLAKALMERYTIEPEKVRAAQKPGPEQTPEFRPNWANWQELFNEYRLRFTHFGQNGSAALGDRIIHIKLDSRQWWVEKRGGSRASVRNRGIQSLRKYLDHHARGYSLFGH